MEKKQNIIKIFYILIILAILLTCIFLPLNKKTNNQNFVEAQTPDENKPSVPKEEFIDSIINYTNFPKKSQNYMQNSKIINIGGTNNENLLKEFVLQDEILLILQSNSNNLDIKCDKNQIAIAILNKDLDLIKTITLEETEDCTYIDCTIFEEGILLFVTNENNSKILLYDNNYKLIEKQFLENVDSGKIVNYLTSFKLITKSDNMLFYRTFDSSLNIVNSTKIPCSFDRFYDKVFKLDNSELFIGIASDNLYIYKSKINNQNNKTYYVIDNICTINCRLCDIMPNLQNNNSIVFSTLKDGKITIYLYDILQEKLNEYNMDILAENYRIIPLNNGYILHNFDNNSLTILDNNFTIILDNLPLANDMKIDNSYQNSFRDNYIFCTTNSNSHRTVFYELNKTLSQKEIFSIPEKFCKITIKNEEDCKFIFLTTNNNTEEFTTLYGGYDIFAIKLQEQ